MCHFASHFFLLGHQHVPGVTDTAFNDYMKLQREDVPSLSSLVRCLHCFYSFFSLINAGTRTYQDFVRADSPKQN